MSIEQALFTSIRGDRLDGYQLAAASPGLDAEDARELTRWSPSHDALLEPSAASESLNFHRLQSGRYCLSHTAAAGEEYSNRGGPRIATRLFVCEGEVLARFANNPFRLYEAVLADGCFATDEDRPQLHSLSLVGGAAPFDALLVASVCSEIGPGRLSLLIDTVMCELSMLAVASPISFERLLASLFSLLPVDSRPEVSFCTGLAFCASRPFRIQPLPASPAEGRRLGRQSGVELLDLHGDAPHEPLTHEWAIHVEQALVERRFRQLAREVSPLSTSKMLAPRRTANVVSQGLNYLHP